MYCEECGEKLDGSPHECKQVQPKQIQIHKKKSIIIGIAISALIISVIVILVGVMLVRGDVLSLFSSQTNKLESVLEDKDTKDRDREEVQVVKGEADERVSTKKQALQVLELKMKLESQDNPAAYMAEFDLIEAFKNEVESLIDKKDYIQAMQVLEKWESFYSKMNKASSNELKINQIDVSAYPIVKVYLGIQDYNGRPVLGDLALEYFYLSEKIDGNESYIKKEITKAIRLDKMENLNINLVADVSGSMQGSPIMYAQEVMRNFVNRIQFQIGDKVSLISFADQVYSEVPFSSDPNSIINAINRLALGDMTALYDALYVAINQTAMQSGAKCIIAFTDGMDNVSQCTPEIVAELATRYGIPIFIIGVGANLDDGNLNYITNSTGGFYRNIDSTSSMDDIYNAIYEQQKDLYLIEYETDQLKDTFATRDLYINYLSEEVVVKGEYKFTPATLMETTTSYAQLFINDFIIYDSDFRYLTVADLRMLTKEQLRLARNEIYARRGRYFVDQELQNYFNTKPWYNPSIRPDDFKEDIFNDYERANAYFIKDYESLNGFN